MPGGEAVRQRGRERANKDEPSLKLFARQGVVRLAPVWRGYLERSVLVSCEKR
jgi:hypothetical protein